MLDFRILGPLEVGSRGASRDIHIHGTLQKTLLITLLLNDTGVVTVDALARELWGDASTPRLENALQAHISRLRRRLEQLEPGRPRPRLVLESCGYRILVDEDELDGWRFQRRLRELDVETSVRSASWMVGKLREALSWWRGPVLGGVLGGRICRAGAYRYELARLRAQEMLFDAELVRGNHSAILAELSAQVTNYSPYLEGYGEQLMIALYRSGRQTDALDLYRRLLTQLAEVGLRPSDRLRHCEQAILDHAPALDLPPTGGPTGRSVGR